MTDTQAALDPNLCFKRVLVAIESRWGYLPAHIKTEIKVVEAALQSRTTAPAEGQSGWLVEKHENNQITYLTLDGAGVPEWVIDASQGLRCCRRSDAEQLAAGSELYDVRIVEHMWPDIPSPPSDAARIAEMEAALKIATDYIAVQASKYRSAKLAIEKIESALHSKLKGDA